MIDKDFLIFLRNSRIFFESSRELSLVLLGGEEGAALGPEKNSPFLSIPTWAVARVTGMTDHTHNVGGNTGDASGLQGRGFQGLFPGPLEAGL